MIFVTAFTVSMVLLLVLTLEVYAAILGQGGVFAFPWGKLSRFQGTFYGVIISLVLSGFFPAYILMYSILMRKLSRTPRVIFSAMIFAITFIFLWLLISDWSLKSEIWLLLPGIVSVAASDFFAEIVTGRKDAPREGLN